MFCKEGVLENFEKSLENTCFRIFFLKQCCKLKTCDLNLSLWILGKLWKNIFIYNLQAIASDISSYCKSLFHGVFQNSADISEVFVFFTSPSNYFPLSMSLKLLFLNFASYKGTFNLSNSMDVLFVFLLLSLCLLSCLSGG